MTHMDLLKTRNRAFADRFDHADISPLPKLGTLILTCVDARVDPAHVLGLELGDAVVFRNNGGRVTPAFIDEVSALAALVQRLTGAPEAQFNIVVMQHSQCGARAFADPAFRDALKDRIGVDVSANAITEPEADLAVDVQRLIEARHLPGQITVAAVHYAVETGAIREIAPARRLQALRDAAT